MDFKTHLYYRYVELEANKLWTRSNQVPQGQGSGTMQNSALSLPLLLPLALTGTDRAVSISFKPRTSPIPESSSNERSALVCIQETWRAIPTAENCFETVSA